MKHKYHYEKRITKNNTMVQHGFFDKCKCNIEKKMHDAKKRVYMRKNCIFVPILKWNTCENKPGGNASEGAYCKMVNIVTDKLFLQEKLKIWD